MNILKKRKRLVSLLLASAMVFGTFAGTMEAVASDGEEKIVTFAVKNIWDGLNPLAHTNTDTDEVQEFIYDRLVIVKTDGTWEPRLAESWELNEAQDVVTINLNQDAKWHDGEPVTAEDVVYTFQLTSNPKADWLRKSNAKYYVGTDDDGNELSEDSIEVIAVDDYTVQLNLKQPVDPMTYFEKYVRDVFILPAHLLSDIPDEEVVDADFWNNPVGSGPFIFDSEVDSERIELVANENYYLGAPKFDRLVVRRMDGEAITAGVLSGEVDITTGVTANDLDLVVSGDSIAFEELPSFQYSCIVWNAKREALSSTEVRRAIDAAINKQAIVDQYYLGYAETLVSGYPTTHPYYNEELPESTYDPELAKQLLEDANWDPDTVLTLQVATASPLEIGQMVQQDLAAVGIKTEIQTYDFATVLQNMRDDEFDLLYMGSAGSIDPTEVTGSITYFSHTEDEYLLDLIAKAEAGLSFEERKPYYDEIQTYVYENGILEYLNAKSNLLVYNTRLSSLPTGTIDFKINKLPWLWEVE